MKIIDIHTHGIGGYDTRATNADEILKIAEIHGSCGVSEILLTIYPSTIRLMRNNIETVKRAIEKQKEMSTYVDDGRTGSAKIIGVHLEGPFLNPSRCGSLDVSAVLEPTDYRLKELIEGFENMVKIITVAPEMNWAVGLIRRISDMGIVVSMGHSNATYTEAEAGLHAGARGITHIFNAMRGFHHREPGIAGFGLLNRDVYIEVIADPFHLHAKTIDVIFRTKNHDRIIIVSDTVKETKDGKSRINGISDTSGNLMGGSMVVTESSKRLITLGYDEDVIMSCITNNPAIYLKVEY